MGTPELAAVSLEALLAAKGLQVVGVVTQPDRPKGRDLKLQPSPVKELAVRTGLPVLQPAKARAPEFLESLRALNSDLIAVAAFGQILPQSLLDLPRFGCINVHTSLLPKYRGAAPIQAAILNGDTETGVTIMRMDEGLDTGPIVIQERVPILPEDSADTLHSRLATLGAELLVRTIPDLLTGKIQLHLQPTEGVSYAPKIKKQDGQIDWTLPAYAIWNRVRALVPWPGAFTFLPVQPQPHLLKIWRADVADQAGPPGEIVRADKTGIIVGCGQQSLRVLELQLEGARRLSVQAFLAGHPLKPGTRFAKGPSP